MSRTHEKNAWARDNRAANLSLRHSASFYLSARRLLLSAAFRTVMPGLVCGSYAIEQLLKAALGYEKIEFPRGNPGHNLVSLAELLPTKPAQAYLEDLQLFREYFDSRYFDNETNVNGLRSDEYKRLDDLYYHFYKDLKIPLQYHCDAGVLVCLPRPTANSSDLEIFQLHNAHFGDYVVLQRSSEELRNAVEHTDARTCR